MYRYKIKKIVKVVDGDTVDILISLGFDTYQVHRVRLFGIDAPESRTRDLEEKARGLKAKEALAHKLKICMNICEINKEASLVIHSQYDKRGKYGRVLGSFEFHRPEYDPVNINRWMVRSGHAVARTY